MPAKNPIIAVVVPKDVHATIRRLAALRGASMSSVVREFLIETKPVLDRVANLLDLAARADKTALKAWAKDLEASQAEIELSALNAMASMDDMQQKLELAKPGRSPAGAERRPRGAGTRTRSPRRRTRV